MAVRRPWIEGLRPVPGSWTLMALRWLLFVAAALPSLAVALTVLGDGIGDRPYFADAPDPMPALTLVRLFEEAPGSVWGVMALAAVLAWLGNLLLTAGAVTLFGTASGDRPRVWRTVFAAGSRYLWVYLRIVLLALVLALLGARLVAFAAEHLGDYGARALWTMRARYLLVVGRVLATVGWLTLVGLFGWWCRVIVVADERRRVRRLLTVVPRLWWRRPLGALLLHYLLALAALAGGGAVLSGWRQSPGSGLGWGLLWLAVLAALSFVWHWRLRAGRLLWSSPDLLDLRTLPDAPWRLFGRLFGRLRRRPEPETPEPQTPEPQTPEPQTPEPQTATTPPAPEAKPEQLWDLDRT